MADEILSDYVKEKLAGKRVGVPLPKRWKEKPAFKFSQLSDPTQRLHPIDKAIQAALSRVTPEGRARRISPETIGIAARKILGKIPSGKSEWHEFQKKNFPLPFDVPGVKKAWGKWSQGVTRAFAMPHEQPGVGPSIGKTPSMPESSIEAAKAAISAPSVAKKVQRAMPTAATSTFLPTDAAAPKGVPIWKTALAKGLESVGDIRFQSTGGRGMMAATQPGIGARRDAAREAAISAAAVRKQERADLWKRWGEQKKIMTEKFAEEKRATREKEKIEREKIDVMLKGVFAKMTSGGKITDQELLVAKNRIPGGFMAGFKKDEKGDIRYFPGGQKKVTTTRPAFDLTGTPAGSGISMPYE